MTVKTLIANTKGGSGKSTTCLNLAGVAVEMGLNVLVVDCDSQGTSTNNSGIKDDLALDIDAHCVSRVLFERIKPSTLICKTEQGYDIIPSGASVSLCENYISSTPNGGAILEIMFSNDKELDAYDLILIDTQGANTQLLNSIALVANDALVPNIASKNNETGLKGVLDIIEAVNFFKSAMNKPEIGLRGHFFTGAEPKTQVFGVQNDTATDLLGDKHFRLFYVEHSTEHRKSEELGVPLTLLNNNHKVTEQWRALFKKAFKEFS